MEAKDERACNNCKYYSQHYCWTENGFCAVNCGHCTHTTRPIGERINYAFVTCCKLWENGEADCEEKKKSILKAVQSMAQRLDEINKIFTDENQS